MYETAPGVKVLTEVLVQEEFHNPDPKTIRRSRVPLRWRAFSKTPAAEDDVLKANNEKRKWRRGEEPQELHRKHFWSLLFCCCF
jgi:hypothetical protein